jgi:hypothetical protein
MKHHSRLRLALFAAVVLTAAASAVSWRAVGAPLSDVFASESGEASDATTLGRDIAAPPVSGGPGFYSISAWLFRNRGSQGWAYIGQELYNSGGGMMEFYAPVSLPNGAAVTKLVVYFWDNSPNDLSASLYRLPLDGSPEEKMAETYPTGDAGHGNSASTLINSPIIDQQAYAYYVEVLLPYDPEVRLRAIRIDYAYKTDLPLVTRQD